MISLAAGSVFSSIDQVDHWRTIIFSVLTFSQMGNAFACRSDDPVSGLAKSNVYLWSAIALTCLLQLAVIYVPLLQHVFHTCPLSMVELLACLGSGVVVFGLIEIQKRFFTSKQ
jgi:Ca2+-transporting ATPase